MSAIGSSASSIQADYLNLLAVQLQNQDPMNPLDNNQMASQLAQLSQLQQMENMSSTFQKVLASQQMSQATGMLGKTVVYTIDGDSTLRVGSVGRVDMISGAIRLHVGNDEVDPANIQSVTSSS
jgi:flagellar basal-body rod modification protein FlgD